MSIYRRKSKDFIKNRVIINEKETFMETLTNKEVELVKSSISKGTKVVLKFSHSLEMTRHIKDCMIVDYVDDEGNIHGIWQSDQSDVMLVPLQDIFEKVN